MDSGDHRAGLGGVAAGDRWAAADGRLLTVNWVRKIGVVCFRGADGQDRVMDIVRFVSSFRRVDDALGAHGAQGCAA